MNEKEQFGKQQANNLGFTEMPRNQLKGLRCKDNAQCTIQKKLINAIYYWSGTCYLGLLQGH